VETIFATNIACINDLGVEAFALPKTVLTLSAGNHAAFELQMF